MHDDPPVTLAEILLAHRHDILRLWVEAVRREAPETRGIADADLISNFPLLFDRLVQGLDGSLPPPAIPESREHAATRKRQGIGLATLLREYTLLQQTIKEFAAERLSYFKVPTRWRISVEPLPRNATGKTMRTRITV